jgi:tetraacyldisaccharide 4'-kinase
MSLQEKIENFWYRKSKLKFLLFPFHLLLSGLVQLKVFLYKIGLLKVSHFDTPVIVVGNITVGGTGKTPFIRYLAKQLSVKGIKIGIVSRGYKATTTSFPHLVKASDSPTIVGDEAYMQYLYFQNQPFTIPMVIDPVRSRAVDHLSKNFELDIIISDDGLQHYAMGRKLEIVMLDGKRLLGNQLMLPFGPLREPSSRLKSVDYIVENSISKLSNESTSKPLIVQATEMKADFVGLVQIGTKQLISLDSLSDKTVSAVAAIGNPERFFKSLSNYFHIAEKRVFPDHHNFTESDFTESDFKESGFKESGFKETDFKSISGDIVIMTEKDAVKCEAFAKDNWYYLQIESYIDEKDFNHLYNLIKRQVLN